jgi:hypothetical protein
MCGATVEIGEKGNASHGLVKEVPQGKFMPTQPFKLRYHKDDPSGQRELVDKVCIARSVKSLGRPNSE